MQVAVAGGTGVVGNHVVAKLRNAGHQPVILARSHGVDLTTGVGLGEKVSGCDAVIDVVNIVTTHRKAAVNFFSRTTSNLLEAARLNKIRHMITLSIVGSEEVDFGYYFGKRAQEGLLRSGGVPWTMLRATQFFEFPQPLLDNRSPVVLMPRMLCRPVAAQDVAEQLVEHVTRTPSGRTRDLAGPEQLNMVDMARRIARVQGRHRLVVPLSLPGEVGRAMSGGGLLPRGDYAQGRRTFSDYLATLGRSTGQ